MHELKTYHSTKYTFKITHKDAYWYPFLHFERQIDLAWVIY